MLTNEQIKALQGRLHWYQKWNTNTDYDALERVKVKELLLINTVVEDLEYSPELNELLEIIYGIDFYNGKIYHNAKRE
ncbi:hypothetical protein [Microaceticoccus formicicus]|uniref:hypothetical protein n=1 Tax=Microaceticoccus formicicus TaxID=3118105 RepID=UPI003CD037FF|nr:hypothetical protein VZL98_01520 [Peptoniphilaceae bacterium AMB_02]